MRENVDLNTAEGAATAKAVVAAKQLFTYKTKFKIPGHGDGYFKSLPACQKLGWISAYVARDMEEIEEKVSEKKPISEETRAALEAIAPKV